MKKKFYNSPVIEIILLDNETSLSLESAPPVGPEESALLMNKNNNNISGINS